MEYFKQIKEFKNKLSKKQYMDLARSLYKLEQSIIYRNGHYIKLDIRYIHDILKLLIRKYMLELDENVQKKWNVYKYLYTEHKKFNLNNLIKNMSNEAWISDYDKSNIKRITKEGNNELHYQNNQDNSSFEEIMGQSREKEYSAQDMIGIAMAIFFTLQWFGTKILGLNLSKYNGNNVPEAFNNGSKSFDVLPNRDEFLLLIGKSCPLCNKGIITKPDSNNYPHGPYLKCNNNICNANVSKSMKIRKNTNITCETHNCIDNYGKTPKLKETYDFKTNNKFIGCIICGELEKKSSLKEYEDDFWNFMEN